MHSGPVPVPLALVRALEAVAGRVVRFPRPLTWQNAPQDVLPDELRDGPSDIPRRADGVLRLPEPSSP